MFGKAYGFTCSLALLCCLGGVSDRASALEPSGTAVGVVPSAAAAGSTGQRVLRVQGSIFMGDRVQTGSIGQAQILFRDNTRLVVGPNSLLTIDSFVFDENNTARKISMNAVKGAFRFLTGNSRKQAYSIRTPSATLGIRGTRFDLAVRANGETSVALFEGQARLCARSTGRCVELRDGCSVAVVSPAGSVGAVGAGQQRAARLRALFPFVVSQARLRQDFRVDSSGCNIRSAAVQPSETESRAFERVQEPSAASAPALGDPPRPDNPSGPDIPDPPTDSGGTKGGWGYGDNNHVHTGPPGLEGKDAKEGKDG